MSEESARRTPTPTPEPSPRRKKFKCNVCQREFNRREHLQRHLTIHYGHKPFDCPHCNYACRRRDLLNRHIKLSHSKDSPGKGTTANPPPPSVGEQSHFDEGDPQTSLSQYSAHSGQADENARNTDNAICDPQIFDQNPGLGPLTSYINGPEPVAVTQNPTALLGTEGDAQCFSFNFLDNVALPFLVEQPALFPELPLNNPFFQSPPVTGASIQPGFEGASLQEQGNPNPLATPPDVGRHHVHLAQFLRISQDDWLWLSREVSQYSPVLLANYELPSRHAISRYLHGFMNGFHPHFPIIHPQTLSLRGMAPELTLALAAVGSQYCMEPHQGLGLFAVARLIAMEKIRLRDSAKDGNVNSYPDSHHGAPPTPMMPSHLENRAPVNETPVEKHAIPAAQDDYRLVETMQALFYLMAMATWGGEHRSLVRQAIATQSMLAMLVRQHGLIDTPTAGTALTWKQWAQAESARRTKLIIFCFFNLHTIALNLPSPLMITDVQLRLPCAESVWKAPDAETWLTVYQKSEPSPFFQRSFSDLLQDNSETPICSSLGSHVLIHALLQHIFSIRQATRLEGMEDRMDPGPFLTLRQALKKWQSGWELNPESSLSPLDKHGPIAFNSTALFHLAYIRLVTDIGAARSLLEQNPMQIATKLRDQPILHRGPMLVLAARHATVALCSPVQMGIYFVGRVPNWSVMHAVCSLEYAYILSQFLQATTAPTLEYPLQPDEQALLTAIKETLCEVESSTPDGDPRIINAMPQLLGTKAVRAWALILQGFRTWGAVDLITTALFTYADMIDPQNSEQQ